MKARSFAVKIVVAALALMASSLWAQDGLKGALAQVSLTAPVDLGTPFSQTLAAADFDGDNKLDGAILVDHGWLGSQSTFRTIELHFTGRGNTALTFQWNETALAISAVDVNSDGATDVVAEQMFTHKRVQVWLNDGRGSFRNVRSEDFRSSIAGNYPRLESPTRQVTGLTLCLPPQRGSEVATLTARLLLDRSSSVRSQSLPFGLPIGSRTIARNSPRAPPLSQSL
jgi:hypothetical protein